VTVWIFNHHALTPKMGGGTRHYDFAKELVSRGHKVRIFASSFHYAQYKELKTYHQKNYLNEMLDGVNFTWIKTRPYQGNGLGRVINMLDYKFKVQKIAFELDEKPDVIIGSSVHLFAVDAAYKVAKKMDVSFVMEVRDIWPLTLINMGISKWHPFVLLLAHLEKTLYKKADKIITLLPEAYKHIARFGVKKEDIVWISNGVDTSRFIGLKSYKNKNEFVVTYLGSMGQANVLHTLMQVAKSLQGRAITFQLIGEGTVKKELQSFKEENCLENVKILDFISKDEVPQVLKNSDVLYLGLKDSPLYEFGMSLNKLFDYLAAEVPIIFASNVKNNLVKEANAGLCISPENEEALIKAIIKIYEMNEEERKLFTWGNLNYIEKKFSVQSLTNELEKTLNGLI